MTFLTNKQKMVHQLFMLEIAQGVKSIFDSAMNKIVALFLQHLVES